MKWKLAIFTIMGMKMATLICIWGCMMVSQKGEGQGIFLSRNVEISFFSAAPIEDIQAKTSQAVSAIDLKTGTVYFKVLMRSFEFPNTLMEEHFNKHYLESDQYPFAEFSGKLTDFRLPDTSGIIPVTVMGSLTIHGVVRKCRTTGTLELKDRQMGVNSVFKVRLADYQIKIPKLLIKNIAEVVEIQVNALYDLKGTETSITQDSMLPGSILDSLNVWAKYPLKVKTR